MSDITTTSPLNTLGAWLGYAPSKMSRGWLSFIESLIVAVVLTGLSYLAGLEFHWIASVNWLEAFAVFTSYSCTYLCVVQRRINYPIGALSTAAYCILFWQTGLLGSAALNLYLTPTLIYGFIRWQRDSNPRPVTLVKDSAKWVPLYLIVTVAAYFGGSFVVQALGGKLAFFDVVILVGTVLAQLLMDNKKLENWIIWAIVDAVAIYVYFSSGLVVAGIQYIFFLLNAVWGFIEWRNSRKAVVYTPAQEVSA